MSVKVIYAGVILLCYGVFCWLCWYRYYCREKGYSVPSRPEASDLLIAYASQTGQAAELAKNTAQQLSRGREPATVLPLDRVDEQLLSQSKNILFVVSTYGEGDPPDMGTRFAHRYLRGQGRDLSHLRYAVLALGDRQYQHFCGFGHKLCQGLRSQAAQPLFDLIEVDRQDPQALALWQQRVVELGGAKAVATSLARPSVEARLDQRVWLNRGSAGAPACHIALSVDQAVKWQAGDIACIAPGNPAEDVEAFLQTMGLDGAAPVVAAAGSLPLAQALAYRRLPVEDELRPLAALSPEQLLKRLPPLPTRDYSIASIPEDGQVELLVRQVRQPNGRLGLGSGWLTEHAPLHSPVRLHIRSNPAFHGPDPDTPLILIGNGTGMAGLRVHLRARQQQGAHRNWLLFGERNAAHDLHFASDITAWQRAGHLQRCDLVFSRDGGSLRYVQDAVAANAGELQRWVADGAAIYLCGSREGMAAGVERVLKTVLTAQGLECLQEQGRYRRDVY